MILDKIIEIQLELLSRKIKPQRVLMDIGYYNALVKELEADRFLYRIHNMKIEIVESHQLMLV